MESASLTQACPRSVPKNVGPPPIRPTRRRNAQLGRSWCPRTARRSRILRSRCAGRSRSRAASARLISPEAADWPIARPSEKLCKPMPGAINSERVCAAVSALDGTSYSAIAAAPRLRKPSCRRRRGDHLVGVDEAHEPDREAADEDRREAREPGPRAVVVERGRVEGGGDRLDPGGQRVPEEEQQDARRGGR